MDNLGLVSIITPSYNSALFIAETIESILSQTYPYWELLITDDCSTDRSIEVIERYVRKDSRIKLFRLEKNRGAGVCRNRSISEAKGRFIAFCERIDSMVSAINNAEL
ncbi:glycosyltransferase family 2 protein [Parabacteroides distasonis]|uniref:glycosyltransferase family 2 protein n=1 Tax=Parabacteroides distasonis TaxID=823 RepID=UPI0039B5D43C